MQTTIREATGTLARTGPGRIRVRIIDEGTGSSGTYTREVLEKAATERAFPRGTQMHLDHSTPGDLMERPEGSLRNLVGVLDEDARYEDGALVAEARIGSAWRSFVDDFGEFIGVSISAAAEISISTTAIGLSSTSGSKPSTSTPPKLIAIATPVRQAKRSPSSHQASRAVIGT